MSVQTSPRWHLSIPEGWAVFSPGDQHESPSVIEALAGRLTELTGGGAARLGILQWALGAAFGADGFDMAALGVDAASAGQPDGALALVLVSILSERIFDDGTDEQHAGAMRTLLGWDETEADVVSFMIPAGVVVRLSTVFVPEADDETLSDQVLLGGEVPSADDVSLRDGAMLAVYGVGVRALPVTAWIVCITPNVSASAEFLELFDRVVGTLQVTDDAPAAE